MTSNLTWAQMNDSMRQIQSLDRDASLKLSGHKWYVDSTIHIAEYGFLRGIAEHRPYPEDAIAAFLETIQNVREPNTLVSSVETQQLRYRWNGSMFARVD